MDEEEEVSVFSLSHLEANPGYLSLVNVAQESKIDEGIVKRMNEAYTALHKQVFASITAEKERAKQVKSLIYSL